MKTINRLAVIDDDSVDQMAVERYCKIGQLADDVVAFHDAESAIHYLSNAGSNIEKIPDVIFLDINLPKLDGWDFLAEYEAIAPKLGKNVAIYMFSSSISELDTAKARNSKWVKDYIYKPISLEKLKRVLGSYSSNV